MSYYDHAFEGPLDVLVYPGKYRYYIVRLPETMVGRLPFDTQLRVRASGEINDLPFHGAWVPGGEKSPYLHLSAEFVARLGVAVGDKLDIRFKVEPSDLVELPDELAAALAADRQADEIWRTLTPGKRRGYAHMVGKAKQADTRRRGAARLLDDLRALGRDA